MKRRSATRSTKLRDPLVFFVDRSLGRHTVVKALRKAGAHAEAHDDHFEQDTPDEVWIPDVSARGWVILTKDARIRRRKNELDAVKLARSRVFVVTTQGMKGSEVADLFVKHIKRIGNLARSRRPVWSRNSDA